MEYIIKNKIKEIRIIHKVGLYFALGALWSFSQVGYSFAFLPWFTFVPFLFMIKYENYKSGFFYSWIFGFSVYLFHFWWMPTPIALTLASDFLPSYLYFLGWIIGWLINLGICCFHGLFYVVVFLLSKYISKKDGAFFYLSIPVVVTVLDYFFPKLWHDQIGYSQFVFFHFSQIADIFGISGISFIIISCNTAAIIFIESFLYKKNINFGAALFFIVIFIIIVSSLYGFFRYKQIMNISDNAKKAKIGIVQGKFSGMEKKDKNKFYEMISVYNDLSKKLLKQNPDLIVWPETAIPRIYDINVEKYKNIKKFSSVPLLTGVHMFEIDKKNKKEYFYNSLVFISKDKLKIDQYHKRKLLPFVERFPLPLFNIILNFIGYQDFSPGKRYKIMECGEIKFAPNICYEAIIPNFIRRSCNVDNKEANLIINATNDSWYGKTIEPKMHLHMTGFRAIENRKSLVRSTCTGYSAIFNPAGDVVYESPLFKQDFVVKKIALLEIKTIYKKWGWFFIWGLAIFLVLIILFSSYRKLKFRYIKSELIAKKIHKRDLYRLWME